MAHIADFMVDATTNVGMNNYIARELSPSSSHDTVRPPNTRHQNTNTHRKLGKRNTDRGKGKICLENASTS